MLLGRARYGDGSCKLETDVVGTISVYKKKKDSVRHTFTYILTAKIIATVPFYVRRMTTESIPNCIHRDNQSNRAFCRKCRSKLFSNNNRNPKADPRN